jgi:hypothetical protein
MSSNEAAHPDPSVVPQNPAEVKGEVEPVKPGLTPALSKVPSEVKTTISKADETIIRISKYAIQSVGYLAQDGAH